MTWDTTKRIVSMGCGALAGCLLAAAAAVAQGEPATQPTAQRQDPQAPKAVPPRSRPRPDDQEALFALFRRMGGLEATFAEEKHLALLAVPLKSTGKLYFLPPGYLARRVETPQAQSVTITPTELRAADKNGEEVIDLRQSADVRLFVTSLVQVFSGNQEALAESYELEYALAEAAAATSRPSVPSPGKNKDAAPSRGWTLTLTPKERPLTEMLRSLRLIGVGQAVVRIEVVDPNGDRTITRIVDADPGREFSAEEKAELFGIESR